MVSYLDNCFSDSDNFHPIEDGDEDDEVIIKHFVPNPPDAVKESGIELYKDLNNNLDSHDNKQQRNGNKHFSSEGEHIKALEQDMESMKLAGAAMAEEFDKIVEEKDRSIERQKLEIEQLRKQLLSANKRTKVQENIILHLRSEMKQMKTKENVEDWYNMILVFAKCDIH